MRAFLVLSTLAGLAAGYIQPEIIYSHVRTTLRTQARTHVSFVALRSSPSSNVPTSWEVGDVTSSRSQEDINHEVRSGELLEGGEVYDFAGVNGGGSRAEIALQMAREEYLATMGEKRLSSFDRILGINSEVTKTVGFEVGKTCSKKEMEDCARYIRSKAPDGFFQVRDGERGNLKIGKDEKFSLGELASFQKTLDESYVETGEITSAFAKTFYLGTTLMSESSRRSIWAVYVWCRRTDEIVDAPRKEGKGPTMLEDLSEWGIRLENLWKYGEIVDPLDLPLLDTLIKYPDLSIQPFQDMIKGMLMDIPGLGQDRYSTFDELHLYCYRVAGTVGVMTTPIFGTSPTHTMEQAKEPALSLGVAFQLTNILRDVGEDAVRGRIYLPKEDLDRFGVTEEHIFQKQMTDGYIKMMKFQIARARRYYERAKRGIPMLSPDSRLPVQASLDCYSQILDKLEKNNFDNFNKRAYVSKEEKLMTLPASWYRIQDIANVIPLWGDKRPAEVGGDLGE